MSDEPRETMISNDDWEYVENYFNMTEKPKKTERKNVQVDAMVIRFFCEEEIMNNKLTNCHDCGAKPGNRHSLNCDVERCSVCGGQRLQCDCKGHSRKFARWTGIWPGKAESDYLGIDLNEFSKVSDIFFIKPKNV